MSELYRNDDPEAARARPEQQLLFPTQSRTVCDEVGLDRCGLLKLSDDGWLSFNPETTLQLNEAQDAELRFLAALVIGGCDPAMLQRLLSRLKKPYSYRMGQIYYDWTGRRWRLLPQFAIKPRAEVSRWINSLKECRDVEQLRGLREEIEDALTEVDPGELECPAER